MPPSRSTAQAGACIIRQPQRRRQRCRRQGACLLALSPAAPHATPPPYHHSHHQRNTGTPEDAPPQRYGEGRNILTQLYTKARWPSALQSDHVAYMSATVHGRRCVHDALPTGA